ncbi:OsmC family peroxiredoxin [Aeromicrobium sp. 636]|uniref:OsmC family protein n=1 Tax=Aeromicrobium senzhongii TaxID=2663859 RepID=A0A8I0ETQ3_9ACTN|nr:MULTISPECIES: OsmC family protein [Aeromicrobium]MBC9226020.1 OsmC family protein [Aeromicrobium senzhongii]MCQ3998127.1 OsmC family peroxiredoxin [Aeromicrobium sp. 636]MTB88555.1 OsmC family peroxiredoxin [Aeromicrobium senzhongii]QNL94131.1 OsmC family protein [Aeromicrobium senzhongii]
MRITATVENAPGRHEVSVTTGERTTPLDIAARAEGGSAVNGGELLAAALATCFVNDLYREAAARGLRIDGVRVTVESDWGDPGEPALRLAYAVHVDSPEDREVVDALVRETDRLAEVHGTVRGGMVVELADVQVGSR